jgi:succinoglycan biosynthesis transport protein ExoP
MNRPATWQNVASLPLKGETESELLDLRGIYRILRYRIRVLVLSAIAGLCIAIAYLMLATPLYTAATQIYIDTKEKKAIDIGEVVPGLGSETAAIDSEVEIIRSTSIARRVIAALNLQDDPAFAGTPGLGALLAPVKKLLGLSDRSQQDQADPATLETLAGSLAASLDVKRIGLTYVISVGYTFRDPETAAKVANQVAEAYLVHQLDAKFEATKRASDWLHERLQNLQAKVNESEQAVELYRAAHNLVGMAQETPYDAQLKRLNEELAVAQVQVDERFAKLQQAREILKKKGELTSIDVVAQSDVVGKLREALAAVSREEAEITTRFTEQHPKVLNKQAERRDLEKRIAEEAKRIVLNLENEHKIAMLRLASIEKSLQDLKDKTKDARSDLIRLKELELEAEANNAVYKVFLNRFKETSQQETLRTADTRVITKAVPPLKPSSPKTILTLVLAVVASLVLGTGIVFLLESLDNTFKTGEQIEERLKIAYLGSVPRISRSELRGQNGPLTTERFAVSQPVSPYAEAIRTIKVGVQLAHFDKPLKILMMTSAQPNEGKTTISANLAQHAAQAGARTLLIDADLRNPSLSNLMAPRRESGLVDVLTRKFSIEQTILRDRSGVDILPGSQVPVHAAEILGSKEMEDILHWARHNYELVILDAAPVAHIIDSRVLAEMVDGIVLVIEWDETPGNIVRSALKSLSTRHERITGAVLNKVDVPRLASYTGFDYAKYGAYFPHYYGTKG